MTPRLRHRLRPGITGQFIGYLMLFSVIPLLVLGFAAYRITYQALQDDTSHYVGELLDKELAYLELVRKQAENLITSLAGIDAIVEGLIAPGEDPYSRLATNARIGYALNNQAHLQGLLSIDLLKSHYDSHDQHHLHHYHVGDTLSSELLDRTHIERLFERVHDAEQHIVWLGIEHNINLSSNHRQMVTVASLLTRFDREALEQEPLGMILVNYKVDFFYRHLIQADMGHQAYMILLDGDDEVIFHPDRDRIGRPLDEPLPNAGRVHTLDGQAVLIDVDETHDGWRLAGVVPLATLEAQASAIRDSTLAVLLVCLTVITATAWRYSHRVVRPVREVGKRFQQFRENPQTELNALNYKGLGEIGELVHGFNQFVEGLRERQELQRAREHSEARFRSLVETSSDIIWETDADGRYRYISPKVGELLGYRPEDMIGRPVHEFLESQEDAGAASLERALSLGQPVTGLIQRHRHRQGHGVDLETNAVPFYDSDGGLAGFRGIDRNATERRRHEDRITHIAYHDSLTELPNRQSLDLKLRDAIKRVRDSGQCLAILYIDLDSFKSINDTLGHSAGDRLLQIVGRRLRQCVRASDIVARMGGDEFLLVVLAPRDQQAVYHIAETVLSQLRQTIPLEGQEWNIGASIGISFYPEDGHDAETLIRQADLAMYQAKEGGRNAYRDYDSGMGKRLTERLSLERQLRQALDQRQFVLHFQPQIDLRDHTLVGLEALLRWQDPERGLVPPGEFIDVLEASPLILPVQEWVLETACAQLREWRDQGLAIPRVSVNLSPRQFNRNAPDLVDLVKHLLHTYRLSPQWLALEITESLLMENFANTNRTLRQLEQFGVGIELDDFGTGYSSLSYLKRLDIDRIKIDRSFIQEISDDSQDLVIVKAIIAMAHALKLEVIAEGVEHEQQCHHLLQMGCHTVQGYYFSRPLPTEQLGELLQRFPVNCPARTAEDS